MVVDGEQKEELVSKIRPQLVSMRRYSSAYSKHLISSESFGIAIISVVLINANSRETAGEVLAVQT